MKTKDFLICLIVVCIIIAISYTWGIQWNEIYCDGARTFFLSNRKDDIIDTIRAAITEEFLWRVIPLFTISCILYLLKYDSSKWKKYLLCSIAFVIVLIIQVNFGMAHYSRIYETEDWKMKHIVLQGSMGLFYATAYNIIQHYERMFCKTSLWQSHLIAYLSSTLVHTIVNTLLIVELTF